MNVERLIHMRLRTTTGMVVTVLALATVILVVIRATLMWPFTLDDAYITLRYSRNLAAGLGPTFNPGTQAEGCTTFLWMVFLAAPHALGLNALLVSKVAGVGASPL